MEEQRSLSDKGQAAFTQFSAIVFVFWVYKGILQMNLMFFCKLADISSGRVLSQIILSIRLIEQMEKNDIVFNFVLSINNMLFFAEDIMARLNMASSSLASVSPFSKERLLHEKNAVST